MDVCVVGSGVIGTIYGYALAEAGCRVTHLVRPGGDARLRDGCDIDLLDARRGRCTERRAVYRPALVDRLDADRSFDLMLASVRHYQVEDLLPTLAGGAGDADILFFNNWWSSFELVDAQLAGRYVWGFPVAGRGFEGNRLVGALLDHVVIGEAPGVAAARVARVRDVFNGCGLGVEIQPDMLAWLWVHFATEAGVIAAAIKSGSVEAFLGNADRIAEAVRAVRDAPAVVAARGVDVGRVADAQMFYAPEAAVAQAIYDQYQTDHGARRIMQRHTGCEELRRIYRDVDRTGHELGVDLPVLDSFERFVEAYGSLAVGANGGVD
jgi:2-dehydropantoate 2-reductase